MRGEPFAEILAASRPAAAGLVDENAHHAKRRARRTAIARMGGGCRNPGVGTDLFAAPPGNPIVAALEALFEAERRRFDEILETTAEAAKRPEVIACWLFGSVARAEDAIESDIDVAVVIDAPRPVASRIADSVREQLLADSRRLAFSPSVVSLTPEEVQKMKDDRSPLWTDIVRDARVLLGPAPDRLEATPAGPVSGLGADAVVTAPRTTAASA